MTPPAFFRNGTPASNLKREGHSLEPVSYQGLPIVAHTDVLHSYCINDMYDITTGDANTVAEGDRPQKNKQVQKSEQVINVQFNHSQSPGCLPSSNQPAVRLNRLEWFLLWKLFDVMYTH